MAVRVDVGFRVGQGTQVDITLNRVLLDELANLSRPRMTVLAGDGGPLALPILERGHRGVWVRPSSR